MECVFVTGGADAVTRAVGLAPQFQWIGGAGPLKSRAEQFTGPRLKFFSKNSTASEEKKKKSPGLKGEDIICLFDYSFHCLDALISC